MANGSRGIKGASSRIAEESFPGWKATKENSMEEEAEPLASHSADDMRSDAAETVMPSQDDLRKKYLGARDAPKPQSKAPLADTSADTDLVELESGPLKKTVAVSKKTKKVIWSQG
jgi:hypothetical protein